jgi:Na+-transporting NADH:ubiquinone oxidoreductase subunit A
LPTPKKLLKTSSFLGEDFQYGINALKKLTAGKVYLGLKAGVQACSALANAKGVETNNFDGPHPAGNVGIQIHQIAPINKGDIVWTINPEDVANMGKLFREGKYDAERTVALTGSEANEAARKYYKLKAGACVDTLISSNTGDGKNRIISGNVLTGSNVGAEGYLCFFDRQITVIPEGEDPEFLGWLIPSYSRPSISKTFLTYLNPNKKFKVNTNTHGEERALVVTGEYEKVLPMDIFPLYLIKAILANDLEGMESLGILEIDEEDMALCEFVCTSKMPIQKIVRQGLELMEKEG